VIVWSTATAGVSRAAVPPVSGAPVGNVTPTTQPAEKVAVVAQSAPVDGRVALLVHNGTTRPVRVDAITAAATSADGSFAAAARTVKAFPQVLAPDEVALAAVTFRTGVLTSDATVTTKVRSTPVSAVRAQRVLSVGELKLSPPQTGTVAQTMGATLTNATKAWTALLPEVAVMCFGEAGTPTTFTSTRASARRITPGRTAYATVPLTSLCPSYLVAARAP
jgi:hypothetical protein